MRSPNIRYLPEVDHLRAVAALWIVAYHGQQLIGSVLGLGRGFSADDWTFTWNPLTALLYEGHTAVALFMVLSGFIFTYGAFGKHLDYRAFVTNRVLRIYPLFVVVLMAGVAFYPQQFDPGRLLTSLFLFANVAPLDLGPMSGMFWAISVECQFYLLFPFLLAYLSRAPARHAVSLVALALALRGLGLLLGVNVRDLSYFHLLGRIDQFVAGMIGAMLLRRLEAARLAAWYPVLAGIAATAVLFGFHRLGGWPSTAGWKIAWPLVEGVTWAAVIVAYVGRRRPLAGTAVAPARRDRPDRFLDLPAPPRSSRAWSIDGCWSRRPAARAGMP
ncbi:MAG: acyltransferase [Vicinamibacterales bacterium]